MTTIDTAPAIVPNFDSEEHTGRKLAIICSKGSLDMAYTGLILANAALGEGVETHLFFTFRGFDMINKKTMGDPKFTMLGNTATHMPQGGSVALTDRSVAGEGGSMKRNRCPRLPVRMPSGFAGFRFPPEVILLAVRWYLRYGMSYRDLEELLAERGIDVDHVTLYRWVQRFTPLLIDAARPARHMAGGRWFVDETYVKVSGVGSYVYRAVDQHGQVIDVYVSRRRDIGSARTFFTAALAVCGDPAEVITDRAPALAKVIEELVPAAWHNTGQYENNRVECDHGRLKARLRPMRGVKTVRTASVVIRGHAFNQNLRRGHYELAVDSAQLFRLPTAFDELRPAI
jgi:IS6 family transposase